MCSEQGWESLRRPLIQIMVAGTAQRLGSELAGRR